jgi:hypothetical protein
LFAGLTAEQFEAQRATALALIETQQLAEEWTTALNDGGINQALAAGDRDALKAALTILLESL